MKFIKVFFSMFILLIIKPSSLYGSPQVTLKNNITYIGNKNETLVQKIYYSYLGIRFAEPPIGNLRFKAPVPLKLYPNQIIDATKFGNICMQAKASGISSLVIGNEDCLVLNVYVPEISKDKKDLLSVIVWIHGGYFFNKDIREFGPDYFMNEEVVVVQINYRMGIWGFLSTGDEASPGNYGLKDVLLGLKWVQSNIQYFGGNKDSVTLYGQSAGAAAVAYLTQSKLSEGLYHKVIMSSGSSLCMWAMSRKNVEIAFTIGFFLGIFTRNSTVLVEKLRIRSARSIQLAVDLNVAISLFLYNTLDSIPFSPTIEPAHLPEAIVTGPMHEGLKNGDFARVPYIIGFNSQDALSNIASLLKYFRPYLLRLSLIPNQLVPASLNLQNYCTKSDVSNEIFKYYFHKSTFFCGSQNVIQFITDHVFVRPIHEHVNLISSTVPVYYYNFSYEGDLGKYVRLSPGTGHAEDIAYIWQKGSYPVQKVTDQEWAVRNRFLRLFCNFAKFGNPTPKEEELLQKVIWKPVSESKNSKIFNMLNIGKDLNPMVYTNPNLDFWTRIFQQYGIPPYSTY